ncbi:MAG: LEA type 2 family protein [Bacteroidales bacterium]|jgi:LEA14-like dessication related protein|nr:LEA type 2 family protein [Bacteroidales bacterium]
MKYTGFILLLIIVSLLFSSCDVKDVTVNPPTNVEIQEISLKNVKIKIYIPIENYNDFSFKIKKADLNLYVNGKFAGKIDKIDKLKIESNSKNVYPVYFEFNPKEALTNILPLMNELQQKNAKFEVDGYIKVSKLFITKKIKVNHKQDFSF